MKTINCCKHYYDCLLLSSLQLAELAQLALLNGVEGAVVVAVLVGVSIIVDVDDGDGDDLLLLLFTFGLSMSSLVDRCTATDSNFSLTVLVCSR